MREEWEEGTEEKGTAKYPTSLESTLRELIWENYIPQHFQGYFMEIIKVV